MRRGLAAEIGNAVAWAAVLVLAAVAILVAYLLGFFGLAMLGLFTWMICTHMQLDDDTPAASAAIFRARMRPVRSPEQSAAARAERQARISPLGFYRRCGIALTAIGVAGFLWQHWMAR